VFNIQYPEGTVPYLPLNELTTHLPQPGGGPGVGSNRRHPMRLSLARGVIDSKNAQEASDAGLPHAESQPQA
jgi:hypothetical protein